MAKSGVFVGARIPRITLRSCGLRNESTAMTAARAADAAVVERLATAGLPGSDIREWLQAEPGETTDFPADRRRFSGYWQKSTRLIGRLPAKPRRSESEHAAGHLIAERAREARVRFLHRHG